MTQPMPTAPSALRLPVLPGIAIAVALALAYEPSAHAHAQAPGAASPAAPTASAPASAPSPTTLPTVQTDMQRGAFMRYKQMNELLSRLRTEGEGLFLARLKIKPLKPDQPLPPRIKLALMDDERTIPIPVNAEGEFDLPTFPAGQADEMELGSNLPKGSTSLSMSIDLSTPPEALDMRTVRRVVKVGQHLRSELLPWYARWLFPQIDGVIVCSDRADWRLEWTDAGQRWALPLPLDPQQRQPMLPKEEASRPCTVLTGQEAWPDSARLVAPQAGNTRLFVKLRVNRPS